MVTDTEGIVNEFALVYHLRKSFPLHYTVFRQTASHIPHEGNSEQLFSRSGALSDNNGKMSPFTVWTSIGVNYSTYKPTDKQFLSATCSSLARAHRPWPSCTRMTLACSTPQETQRATWFRPAVRPAAAAESGSGREHRRLNVCLCGSTGPWGHGVHEWQSFFQNRML